MPSLRYFILFLLLCFPATGFAKDEKLKVAFVYQGAADIPGWAYQHDLARQAVEKYFGDKIAVTIVDKLQPGPDAERVITGLARADNGIIFVTSSNLSPAVTEAAKRFPDIYFEIAQGSLQGDNISTYDGRFYEARYIMGKIAARESASGVLGYVAATPNIENICEINAFMLGAQSEKADVTLNVAFAGEDFTTAAEAKATRAVIDAGADVLSYQTHTPAPAQIAEQNGVKVFGDASDMSDFAPQMQIGALVHDWSGYYIRRITTVLEGKWAPVHVWVDLRNGVVTLSPFKNIADKTRDMALEARQQIIDDKLKVFTGPIADKDGVERIKKGEVAGDDALRSMNWYVKGNIRIIE
jgi:basic membrane protein A